MWVKYRIVYLGGLAALLAIGLGIVTILLAAKSRQVNGSAGGGNGTSEEEVVEGEADLIRVKTILPKRDPNFVMVVHQPAYVEAYFQADLQARVAGQVKFVAKDKGDTVSEGELLLEIDVPDLVEEVG